MSLLSDIDWKLLTLTGKSTWTELLEKFKKLILEAKNTDSKDETVKQKSKKQNYQS